MDKGELITKTEIKTWSVFIALLIIGLVLISLKVWHVIDWSWWWITCPFWLPFAAFIVWVVSGLILIAMLFAIDTSDNDFFD